MIRDLFRRFFFLRRFLGPPVRRSFSPDDLSASVDTPALSPEEIEALQARIARAAVDAEQVIAGLGAVAEDAARAMSDFSQAVERLPMLPEEPDEAESFSWACPQCAVAIPRWVSVSPELMRWECCGQAPRVWGRNIDLPASREVTLQVSRLLGAPFNGDVSPIPGFLGLAEAVCEHRCSSTFSVVLSPVSFSQITPAGRSVGRHVQGIILTAACGYQLRSNPPEVGRPVALTERSSAGHAIPGDVFVGCRCANCSRTRQHVLGALRWWLALSSPTVFGTERDRTTHDERPSRNFLRQVPGLNFQFRQNEEVIGEAVIGNRTFPVVGVPSPDDEHTFDGSAPLAAPKPKPEPEINYLARRIIPPERRDT